LITKCVHFGLYFAGKFPLPWTDQPPSDGKYRPEAFISTLGNPYAKQAKTKCDTQYIAKPAEKLPSQLEIGHHPQIPG